jgi:hypothetical protein
LSNRLRKQVEAERKQLHQLLATYETLMHRCASGPPDAIELSALAAMLHAFYTGVENTFRRIEVELGESLPEGADWHRQLLRAMARPGAARPPVISPAMEEILRDYLGFRHVFRQAYTFQLKWTRMSVLVLRCDETLRQLERELDAFLPPRGT